MKNFFAFLVLITLFAIFVWPTRYQYFEPGEYTAADLAVDIPIRVDRITGDIEIQGAGETWHKTSSVRRAVAFERPAVDPNATKRPSLEENERVVNQGQRSIERTQEAVTQHTQK